MRGWFPSVRSHRLPHYELLNAWNSAASIKVKVICVKSAAALIYQDLRVYSACLTLPVCTKAQQYHPHITWNALHCFSPHGQLSVLIPKKNWMSCHSPSDKCKFPFLRLLLFSPRKIRRWWKTPKRCFHQTDPVSHLSKVTTWTELVVFLSLICIFLNFWRPKCRPCGEKLKTNLQSLYWVGHADNLHTTQYFRSKTLSVYEVLINYPSICLHFLRAGW